MNTLVDLSSPQGQVQRGQVQFWSKSFLLRIPAGFVHGAGDFGCSPDVKMSAKLTTMCDAHIMDNALQELSQALDTPSRGKQPGSDGLPYEFYQAFWPLLRLLPLAVFVDAFEFAAEPLTPTQLLGTIVLLYKVAGPAYALTRPRTVLSLFSMPTPSSSVKHWQSGGERSSFHGRGYHPDCLPPGPLNRGQCPCPLETG